MDNPTPALQVRPFQGRAEYERMVDYFLDGDESFLRGMGMDPAKLPAREAWIEESLRDQERPDAEKDRCYLIWLCDGEPIGHSSINQITIGEAACIHLHLWAPDRRRAGLGTRFFQLSADAFARRFRLKRIFCEPYAENPAPNRVLVKAGFRFLKRYRTVPGPRNFEQDVNRYVREVERTNAR